MSFTNHRRCLAHKPAQICTARAVLRKEVYFIELIPTAFLELSVQNLSHDREIRSMMFCIYGFLPVGVGLDRQVTALLLVKRSQTR